MLYPKTPSKTASSNNPHFAVFHWGLYPTHLFPIHLPPNNTGHALWPDWISGSAFRNRLYQTIPSPNSGNTDTPAKGQTVAPPRMIWKGMTCHEQFYIMANLKDVWSKAIPFLITFTCFRRLQDIQQGNNRFSRIFLIVKNISMRIRIDIIFIHVCPVVSSYSVITTLFNKFKKVRRFNLRFI